MNILVPNYYHKFRCIADKCMHSCCKGWEIDIDKDTLSYYNSIKGEIGEKIRQNIFHDADCSHFILKEGDVCPFLNEKGLCDIICALGEDALCDICSDHPRFRNFYSDFTELGLGLCCEEAARIILNSQERFSLLLPEDAEKINVSQKEKYYLDIRNMIINKVQQRELSIKERFLYLAKEYEFDFSSLNLNEVCDTYLLLERLEDDWTEIIKKLKSFHFDLKIFDDEKFFVPFEQLVCYFIFRHFSKSIDEGDIAFSVRFALLSCYVIGALCSMHEKVYGSLKVSDLENYARMYSCEVEYSDENMNTIYHKLK